MSDAPYRVLNVVGARPNLMKVAPLLAEMRRCDDLCPILVHTGQHYDHRMSGTFFDELALPQPDYALAIGSGTHHQQTAEIVRVLGELIPQIKPDLMVVVGDVNSTMAAALVAAKERIPLAHVEAGLRSFDRAMPEEINRLVTDAVSDLLFTTEDSASANLLREGASAEKIFFVGNVMIDSLAQALRTTRRSDRLAGRSLMPGAYAVLTLHRPSNVDSETRLRDVLQAVAEIARDLPVIFPVHPRTEAHLGGDGSVVLHPWDGHSPIGASGIWKMPPASYLDFVAWMDHAALVITDSGGIQDETTYLGVPCLTFRENTERPVTVSHGTNRVVGTDPANLVAAAKAVLRSNRTRAAHSNGHHPPLLWDGHTSPRIVQKLREFLHARSEEAQTKPGELLLKPD